VALVGASATRTLSFRNAGGAGRFCLVPAGQWPPPAGQEPDLSDLAASASVGPFSVQPVWLDLQPGETGSLELGFHPKAVGVQQERLVFVCDNCQVKEFTLQVGGQRCCWQRTGCNACRCCNTIGSGD
jgi:hypothetical protein